MRDNTKGGALTEVTFYILLSLYTPKHGYAVMQFIEVKQEKYDTSCSFRKKYAI